MSDASRGWPAPAKLNLFLHLTGRRADGYHLLQTVFQLLDYGDSLDFEWRSDGVIRRETGPDEVPAADDLAVRAAGLLREAAGISAGVSLRLHKRLPIGGGLGGGSSDAATVLVALNRLWRAGLSPTELAALGLELGADVPVFVHGYSAWAEGIGEILTPLSLPETWYLVICPPVRVATREMFQVPELTRNSPSITIARFRAGPTRNDFEPAVRRHYPAVAEALDWLGHHGRACLSGSGACVFAEFAGEATARSVLRELPPAWRGFVARGCNRSPLLERLEAEPADRFEM